MNPKIKKIIVRELLIFIGSGIVSVMSLIVGWIFVTVTPRYLEGYLGVKYITVFENIMGWIFFFLMCNYPIYLLTRFIIWAVRKSKWGNNIRRNNTSKILIFSLTCIVLISCAIGLCNANKIKQAKLETSIGTFIIEGKYVKGGGGGFLMSYPEYDITVKKGDNKISFYANGDYYPREKVRNDEEALESIFISFLARAYKAATLNYDEFYKKYYQAWGEITDTMNEGLQLAHKPEINFQEKSKKYYEECQSNLNKIKILLGDTPDFLSKLNSLYNDSLVIRKKIGTSLDLFLES